MCLSTQAADGERQWLMLYAAGSHLSREIPLKHLGAIHGIWSFSWQFSRVNVLWRKCSFDYRLRLHEICVCTTSERGASQGMWGSRKCGQETGLISSVSTSIFSMGHNPWCVFFPCREGILPAPLKASLPPSSPRHHLISTTHILTTTTSTSLLPPASEGLL